MSKYKCIDCGHSIPMSAKDEREGVVPPSMICPSCRDDAAKMDCDDLRDALMDVGIPFIN